MTDFATQSALLLLLTASLLLALAACDVRQQDIGELPLVDYEAPVNCYVGQTIVFDATASSDPEGEIAWYSFDFGDGTTAVRSNQPVVTYSWSRAGTYWTSVTVVDVQGNKSTDLREMIVTRPEDARGLRCQDDRPFCPPFYACNTLSFTCDPVEVFCGDTEGTCPETLECFDGLCVETREP